MIKDVTGIQQIRMLYLQLLYRCNFNCLHCFHGERLKQADAFTAREAVRLIQLMRDQYGTDAVTLLGGEPFVYRDLPEVVWYAKRQAGLRVEICTNGYRIERQLPEIAPYMDVLRVSLEGVGSTNDRIRRAGSYQSALSALTVARDLGVRTGGTMTVTSQNTDEVLPLARTLQEHGAEQLKLHCLRPVGNAEAHPELQVTKPSTYARMREQIRAAALSIDIVVDEDLSEGSTTETHVPGGRPREIDRIEADPRGALTMSCKAVGTDSHAFWYEKAAGCIVHRPSATDELSVPVRDVVYAHA